MIVVGLTGSIAMGRGADDIDATQLGHAHVREDEAPLRVPVALDVEDAADDAARARRRLRRQRGEPPAQRIVRVEVAQHPAAAMEEQPRRRCPAGVSVDPRREEAGGASLRTAQAEAFSHMLFATGPQTWLARLLATHPPLDLRIGRIYPLFLRRAAGRELPGA